MANHKLTPLALAVMELLHEKPMHPYEIAQLMRKAVDRRVKVKAVRCTTRLTDSRRRSSSRSSTPAEGKRPERTVYANTAGREALDAGQESRHRREEYPSSL